MRLLNEFEVGDLIKTFVNPTIYEVMSKTAQIETEADKKSKKATAKKIKYVIEIKDVETGQVFAAKNNTDAIWIPVIQSAVGSGSKAI